MSLITTIELNEIRMYDRRHLSRIREVICLKVGNFGIFKWGDGWNVTHIKTGLAVNRDCCCVIGAVHLAESLDTEFNWDRTLEELKLDPGWSTINILRRRLENECPLCHPLPIRPITKENLESASGAEEN